MSRARRRSMYCTPAEWAGIAERADDAGMSISGFLIACALAEDEEEMPETLLALTEEEQRTQYDRIARIDRWARAMYERMPGADVSMVDAIAVLDRVAEARWQELASPEGRR